MAKRRYAQGDVQWFLPNKKKPFAYSTVAESDAIKSLLQEFGDLKTALMAGRILSEKERLIMEVFVEHGIYKPNLR